MRRRVPVRDMDGAVHWAAMGSGATSLTCILVLRFFMGVDPGLTIFKATPFTDWGQIARQMRATARVACPPQTGWPRNDSALESLLDAAFCLDDFWPNGTVPTNRSEVCACVTAAWDGLAQAACQPGSPAAAEEPNDAPSIGPPGGTAMRRELAAPPVGPGDVEPGPEVLSQYAGQALGCMALPPQYRTDSLGYLLAGVMPTGVALYCNGVVFIASASYLLFFFFGMGTGWIWIGMSVQCAFIGVLLVYQSMGQLLVLPSLVIALLNILLGLGDERQAGQGRPVSDELEVCCYGILPQILPAYALVASVAGFGRDVGACGTFMALGLFLGVAMQWLRLVTRNRPDGREPLLGSDPFWEGTKGAVYSSGLTCLGVHWLQLLAMGLAYYAPTAPYMLSRTWLWVLLALLLCIGTCALDAASIFDPPGEPPRQGLQTCLVLAALVVTNVLLTGMACHDAVLA